MNKPDPETLELTEENAGDALKTPVWAATLNVLFYCLLYFVFSIWVFVGGLFCWFCFGFGVV